MINTDKKKWWENIFWKKKKRRAETKVLWRISNWSLSFVICTQTTIFSETLNKSLFFVMPEPNQTEGEYEGKKSEKERKQASQPHLTVEN